MSAAPLPLAAASERLRGKPGRPRAAAPRDESRSLSANMPPPRLLDVSGAARYLSVSAWTVRDLHHAGKLPRVRILLDDTRDLRRLLFDVRDLDALVDASKEGPA